MNEDNSIKKFQNSFTQRKFTILISRHSRKNIDKPYTVTIKLNEFEPKKEWEFTDKSREVAILGAINLATQELTGNSLREKSSDHDDDFDCAN